MTGEELDADARVELRTLPKDLAARVARHLVMAGRLVDEDPAMAYKHARAARRLASRVGLVREAAGLAAYHAGEWADAVAELRAARRLRNSDDAYLPILADSERGLGRPERALDIAKSPEARRLEPEERIELRIVESGARRDLRQYDAAVVALQIPELRDKRLRPWSARLFYAFADALVDARREEEASEWFARAAAADRDGETDAAERYAELEGLEIVDTEVDDAEDVTAESPADLDEPLAEVTPDSAEPDADVPAEVDGESSAVLEEASPSAAPDSAEPDVEARDEAEDVTAESPADLDEASAEVTPDPAEPDADVPAEVDGESSADLEEASSSAAPPDSAEADVDAPEPVVDSEADESAPEQHIADSDGLERVDDEPEDAGAAVGDSKSPAEAPAVEFTEPEQPEADRERPGKADPPPVMETSLIFMEPVIEETEAPPEE